MFRRLTFGRKPNPDERGTLSEIVCDLINVLMNCKEWNQDELFSLHQPLVPDPMLQKDDVEFAEALPTFIRKHEEGKGKADVYIDDIGVMAPDIGDNKDRANAVGLFALHLVARLKESNEPIQREHIASLKKIASEGRLE